jgi:hypothetical protein
MKSFILTLLVLSGLTCYSQDYLDKIANATCECVNKLPDTLKTEDLTMQFGVCMIEGASPYKKQLKKDYQINLDKLDLGVGETLGKLIGVKMVSICSDQVLRLSKKIKLNKVEKNQDLRATGVVTKIESDYFVTFYLKDESGKVTKFYWMTLINSDFDLITKYKSVTDKSVDVTYRIEEFFDPKIDEYRQFNIITAIELRDN